MTIVHRFMYSTFGGGDGSSGPSTSKPNTAFATLNNSTHWAVGAAPSKPYVSKIPTTTILACSSRKTQVQLLASREVNGPLCRHRKGFLDHLRPRPVIVSTLRIITQQGTLVAANFMTEQLQKDAERNEQVYEGKLTQMEADEQGEEWQTEEWKKRWTVFPSKLFTALAKYHAITLVMRLYESIADRFYDKFTLDKLTMDPFYAAQKLAGKDQFESSIRTTSKARTNSKGNMEIASAMFQTTMWANVIGFLSDFSVHQVVLCYGYYIYIRERRKRIKQQQEQGESFPPTPRRQQQDEEDDRLMDQGAILASFLKKSTRLLVSRGVGLLFCSCGSAVGTIVYPGWGTLLFANLGEGMVGTLLDESSGKESI